MKARYIVETGARRHTVEIREAGDGYEIEIDGVVHEVDSCRLGTSPVRSLLIGGRSYETNTVQDGDRHDVYLSGEIYPVIVVDEIWARAREAATPAASHGEEITAPIPGSVVGILVSPGDTVAAGASIVVLEAMKMQNELLARGAGVVTGIHVAVGDTVAQGQRLVVIEAVAPAPAGEAP
jgi:acetyl/propionyl-CoA carboxylase alpha subunit